MSKIKRHGIAMPFRKTLLAVVVLISIQTHAADITEGEWVGGSDLFESPAFVHLDISTINNAKQGVINIPQWKVIKRAVLNLKINGVQIYFEIFSNTGVPFVAQGTFTNGVIEGVISRGDKKGKFHLILIKKVPSAILSKYVGCYNIPDPANKGAFLPHLVSYSSSGHLRFVNLSDGSTTMMLPISNDKFFFAGAVMTSAVPSSTLSFMPDDKGNTNKFSVSIPGLAEQFGAKLATYKVEEVKAFANDHELAATLLMPGGDKKHPVVIIVPGSQGMNRDDNTPYEEINTFISNGFGLLIYDKQGTGRSGGDWQKASYEQLAEDVLAFVKELKIRKDVDSSRIGAWGFSQGASIAPLAASLSNDISFVIMQSGGGITPAEAEINQQVARMQAQKFSDTAINEAIEFMQLQFKAVNSKEYWDSLQARIPSAKTKPWSRFAFGMLPKDNWLWNWWKPIVDFNPAVSLEKIKIPVLVIFGSADPLVPKDSIDGMISRITEALNKAGNNSVTVAKFENANHEIFVQNEKKQFKLAEGYDETLKRFILKIKASEMKGIAQK
jgi:pimeloyl-ACP methyl ester carboxylesterase